jgi:hypothetical protein
VLILTNDFRRQACPEETRGLFDHHRATAQFGASIFWLRPAMLLTDNLEDFIAHWQLKRDGTRRGIVEVRP